MLTRIGSPMASGVAAFVLALSLSGAAVGVALVADTVSPDDEMRPRSSIRPRPSRTSTPTASTTTARPSPSWKYLKPKRRLPLRRSISTRTARSARPRPPRSDRVGGKNCNHGGYVSGVAKGDDEDARRKRPTRTRTPPPSARTASDDEPTSPRRARRGRRGGRGARTPTARPCPRSRSPTPSAARTATTAAP